MRAFTISLRRDEFISQNTKERCRLFEKEIVFEEGAAVSISIGYNDATPFNVIKAVSSIGILLDQASENHLMKRVSSSSAIIIISFLVPTYIHT